MATKDYIYKQYI